MRHEFSRASFAPPRPLIICNAGSTSSGAVEQEIEAPDLLETADNESQRGRQIVRGLAGGDAAKVQPLRRGALRQGGEWPASRPGPCPGPPSCR